MDGVVEPRALHARLMTGDRITVIDVRDPEEYAAGHLPGAINIPAAELPARLAEVPTDRPAVPYCAMRHRGASRGERVAALLRGRGHEARALDGGLPAWRGAGLPIEAGE